MTKNKISCATPSVQEVFAVLSEILVSYLSVAYHWLADLSLLPSLPESQNEFSQ